MNKSPILVADLGQEWLNDAEFKEEFDALADEFAQATARFTAGACEASPCEEPRVLENEIPLRLG